MGPKQNINISLPATWDPSQKKQDIKSPRQFYDHNTPGAKEGETCV